MLKVEEIKKIIDNALHYGGFKTKKNLAKYLDIDPSAINQWVKSENIPPRHLKVLEKFNKNKNQDDVQKLKDKHGLKDTQDLAKFLDIALHQAKEIEIRRSLPKEYEHLLIGSDIKEDNLVLAELKHQTSLLETIVKLLERR